MMDKQKLQEIAREISRDCFSQELPSLEQISWAFPIIGRDRTYYARQGFMDRIPNTQEGNAIYQLMLFKNLNNVLRFLGEGRTVTGVIPNHTIAVGGAEDMAYMAIDYLPHVSPEMRKQKNLGQQVKQEGFYWGNIPSELVDAVIKTDDAIRVQGLYEDEQHARNYLENIVHVLTNGRVYLERVVKSKDQASNYPQLVLDNNVGLWRTGDRFQWGLYSNNQPMLINGNVISNGDSSIKFEVLNVETNKPLTTLEMPHDKLNVFDKSLWKLIAPGSGD